MQKILWGISLLAILNLVQSEILYSQKNNPDRNQPHFLLSDSSKKNIVEFYDAYDTDALQEDLYLRIKSKIQNRIYKKENSLPKTKFQFLQSNLKYYPEATLNNELLVIPYPHKKFKRLKEIRYRIPANFFSDKNDATSLQPEVTLQHNPERSTITFNNSYALSYYRSPGATSDGMEESTQALQKIFNLILPYAQKYESDETLDINGHIYFKAYQSHNINLTSIGQFSLFLDEIREEGSLYFYPSKIDILQNKIIIIGLLYVIKEDILNIYHFGELNVTFKNT